VGSGALRAPASASVTGPPQRGRHPPRGPWLDDSFAARLRLRRYDGGRSDEQRRHALEWEWLARPPSGPRGRVAWRRL